MGLANFDQAQRIARFSLFAVPPTSSLHSRFVWSVNLMITIARALLHPISMIIPSALPAGSSHTSYSTGLTGAESRSKALNYVGSIRETARQLSRRSFSGPTAAADEQPDGPVHQPRSHCRCMDEELLI